jgi:hypothetical protein
MLVEEEEEKEAEVVAKLHPFSNHHQHRLHFNAINRPNHHVLTT